MVKDSKILFLPELLDKTEVENNVWSSMLSSGLKHSRQLFWEEYKFCVPFAFLLHSNSTVQQNEEQF